MVRTTKRTSSPLVFAQYTGPFAAQHGHSVTTMMKDYAKWIPKADRGRNRAAVNKALGQESVKEVCNDE